MKKHIDFHHVEHHQLGIHDRLTNWAAWVQVKPQRLPSSPIFALYKPAQHWDEKEYRPTCDVLDAQRVEKLIGTLPPSFAFALRWWYVYRFSPAVARREMATSYEGLHRILRDGRQMMLNLVD
jgi:hypothetical protein